MEVLTLTILEDLDVHHPTFATPDLTTFCRLDELGLRAVGQLLSLIGRCWSAASSRTTCGVGSAARRACRVTR